MTTDISWPGAQEEGLREREFYRYYAPLHASSQAPELQHIDLYDESAAKAHKPRNSHVAALTAFCQLAAMRVQTKRAMLFFFDRDNAYVLAEATQSLSLNGDGEHDACDGLWLGAAIIPRGLAVCEHTVNISSLNQSSSNAGLIHIINDLAQDTRFCDRPYVKDGPMARFYAGVPLITPAGYHIGALCVLDDQPRDGLDKTRVRFLCDLSSTIMDHMDAVRARAESSRSSHMLSGMASFLAEPSHADAAATTRTVPPLQQQDATSVLIAGDRNAIDHNTLSRDNLPRRPRMPPREPQSSFAQKVSETFSAAAALIRTACEADGVAFIDANDNQKTTVNVAKAVQRQESAVSIPGSNYGSTPDADGQEKDVSCSVLGQACLLPTVNLERLTARFLCTLIKRYPAGKLWYFDRHYEHASESLGPHSPASSSKRELGKHRIRAILRKVFPGVRAVGMVSTYNYLKDQVYAVGFIWTFAPVRILTFEADLNLLRAFGDIIMGHIYRLGVQNEEVVRSDFVSSISHELRSPIHGILGSIDLLRDAQSLDWSVVEQIEKCSINLLDVIEHLLEYSRINRRARGSGKRRQQHLSLNRAGLSTSVGREHVQDVIKLVEEVADMMFYSHCCSVGVSQHGRVAFVLNVNPRKTCEAKVNSGALKRICANLISNALKYTTTGHVVVSIDTVYRPLGPTALLKIVDTGCGMSADFVQHHLFRAFSQENVHLAGGTGLGLSIVAQLVKEAGGQLDIQSVKGTGTTALVTLPLNVEPMPVMQTSATGLSVKLLQTDVQTATRAMHVTAIVNNCARLGVTMDNEDCDISLIFEDDLPQILSTEHREMRCLILLCTSFTSAIALGQSQLSTLLACPVQYVAQPYGPEQLAKALVAIARVRSTWPVVVSPNVPPIVDTPESVQQGPATYADPRAPMLAQYIDAYVEVVRRRVETRGSMSIGPAGLQHGVTEDPPLVTPYSTSIDSRTPASETSQTWPCPETSPVTSPEAGADDGRARLPTLLLVDDNSINLRLLVAFADEKRYRHFTAMNGREAVDAYEQIITKRDSIVPGTAAGRTANSIVILMDINMPVMDGYAATQAIRAFEQKHDIAPASIVAVTALGSPEAKEAANAAGFNQFLTKPVRLRRLESLLKSLCQ